MNPMKSKRAIWWGVGLFLALSGLFAVSVLLPSRTNSAKDSGPDVHVPAMRNAPTSSERRLELEVPSATP